MTEGAEMVLVKCSNLSEAWIDAMAAVSAPGVASVVPLIVNIAGFEAGGPAEHLGVRRAVDAALLTRGRKYCATETTANTIFPESMWRRHRLAGADEFMRRYAEDVAPRLRVADRRNRKGTYFERMVNYQGTNQLAHMLATWGAKNHRTSALQAVIFDPSKDHTPEPFLGFPCLDHIAFAHDNDGLSLLAFYASQYIFDRAYGNYLGLCRLGNFMGDQMGLTFRQLTCVAGCAKMGAEIKKGEAATLLVNARSLLAARPAPAGPPSVNRAAGSS
jgi:hypothetical protein